jgi:hypothetical protein
MGDGFEIERVYGKNKEYMKKRGERGLAIKWEKKRGILGQIT